MSTFLGLQWYDRNIVQTEQIMCTGRHWSKSLWHRSKCQTVEGSLWKWPNRRAQLNMNHTYKISLASRYSKLISPVIVLIVTYCGWCCFFHHIYTGIVYRQNPVSLSLSIPIPSHISTPDWQSWNVEHLSITEWGVDNQGCKARIMVLAASAIGKCVKHWEVPARIPCYLIWNMMDSVFN